MRRCGSIPYILLKSPGTPGVPVGNGYKLWFLLARHKATGELGDFGGGIKKIETTLEGGIRELHEESRGIFENIYKTPSDMASCITLVDRQDMAEIFIPLDPEWFVSAKIKFHATGSYSERSKIAGPCSERSKIAGPCSDRGISRTKKKLSDEISELVWVSEETLDNLILGAREDVGIMWNRISIFLRRNPISMKEKFYQCLRNHALLLSVSVSSGFKLTGGFPIPVCARAHKYGSEDCEA